MLYSIEPRDRRYVKGYGFLSFAKNIGKNKSSKYGQKLVDTAKKSGETKAATDTIRTASKTAVQKKQKQQGIWLAVKFLIILRVYQKNLQKNCPKMKLIMKHQKKDKHLQKKDNKLLMN